MSWLNSLARLSARFRRLSTAERRLFFGALALVTLIRLALWTVPFRMTQKAIAAARRPVGKKPAPDRGTIRRVAWAVEAASRRVPGATCLTQGLAVQVLLGRLGQPSELRLGVAQTASGKLEAHAWVEANGRVIIGGAVMGFQRYTRLQRAAH